MVEEQGELLGFLLDRLSNRSRNSVKGIMTRGQVSVNGQAVTKHNHPLRPGDRVTIHFGMVSAGKKLNGLQILHEDDDIIVINKEAGLLSIATAKERDLTAYKQLMDHVRSQNARNRIFIVHRLDRDTSGVMMFAKNEKAKRLLQSAWQEAVLERTYIALVAGRVEQTKGTMTSWLKETKTYIMVSSKRPGSGQKAVTHYSVLKSNRAFSLLEVHLETGRKNQIRVHMQDLGHPIVGDKKYGSKKNVIGRLGLHAQVLAFKHPITGKHLRFETTIPDKFLQLFG
nr:RluA family pseudouridine synthase [Scopulibacillus darangshiensis]